jgi:hypothetical protein
MDARQLALRRPRATEEDAVMIRVAIVPCLVITACANPPTVAEQPTPPSCSVTLSEDAQNASDAGWNDAFPLTDEQRASAISAYNEEPGDQLPDGVDAVFVFHGDDVPPVLVYGKGLCAVGHMILTRPDAQKIFGKRS